MPEEANPLAPLLELGEALNPLMPHNLVAAALARAEATEPAALFARFEAERARVPLKMATLSSETPELLGLFGLPKYAVTLQYGGARGDGGQDWLARAAALAPHNVLAAALTGAARPPIIESPAERGPGPRVPTF